MTQSSPVPYDRWPATKIEMWQVADLVPYARNARTHPPEQIDQIAASMERFGFTIPMLVAEDGTIIAGHGRLMAAAQLGLAEVPVMVARGWSEEDRRLYTLADNRLAETSEWDPAMLQIEIDELRADYGVEDLSFIGFTEADLAGIMPALPAEVTEPEEQRQTLASRFGVVPFSVMNAREGWWQDRKRAWLALGIRSELGRGENGFSAAPGGSPMVSGYDKEGNRLVGLKSMRGSQSA